LYNKIQLNVEDSFYYDHNMIVEEFSFYQQLSSNTQTEVIKEVFGDFIKKFDHFLGSWEVGFRNEFVIQLYTRKYKEYDIFVQSGYDVDQISMITKGSAQMVSNEDSLFMILPEQGVFGDFNIAFNTKSMVTLRGAPQAIDNKGKPKSREE